MSTTQSRDVAVIGSGVAGLVAAHELGRHHRVTLYEADDRLGGHADTHDVDGLAIDTGFIVHNARTYPHLLRIFAELGVETQPSEMSLSVRDDESGVEWAGALGLRGLFPGKAALRDAGHLRTLTEIPRFHRAAKRLLARDAGSTGHDQTLKEFLDAGGFSAHFRRHFMTPLVAAVWSCDPSTALDYPARYLFTFLAHHGMLQVFGSPQWRTVTGGSREYVDRIAKEVSELRLATPVTWVRESADGVLIRDADGDERRYDAVVVATHPEQALAILADPTPAQSEILGAIGYTPNTAILHTDTSLMPKAGNAWASWNYLARPQDGDAQGVCVTYDLTRLQRLATDTHYLVTLGGEDLIDPAHVIARREYAHPTYTPHSVAARDRRDELDTARIHFAGAWQGWGFHEDGARSGVEAARRITTLLAAPAPTAATTGTDQTTTGIYRTEVRHTRRRPWRRQFTHASHHWLVDLDDLPDHGLLGRFSACDHLGDTEASIRSNVDNFLAHRGIHLDGGRVLMAAQPRAWGFCFNPISVFWCFGSRGGALEAVVVEVHNTYGDRHAYLVRPDEHGSAATEKAMYVSPFHDGHGSYRLHLPVPGDRLDVGVQLTTRDGATFSASLSGVPIPTDRRTLLGSSVASLVGAAQIRAHGIWLWLRRLPVQRRPEHSRQRGVQ
ncbi:FAD-dependent oxidoreductase [Nocardioides sp. Bht2]|uniref:FAD-dependent oxidoreductase n=1 Tax=Nocardioides sp. Bht2 TaxID=3392297 RepID=UPI0039B4CA55